MPELTNGRHDKFAQGLASGLTDTEAYCRVDGSNSKNADVCANDWMKQAGVKERIAELRAEQNSKPWKPQATTTPAVLQRFDWVASSLMRAKV